MHGAMEGGYEARGLSGGSRTGSGVEMDGEKLAGLVGERARMGCHRDMGWEMVGSPRWALREAWENED